jgi:hypothetical protein
MPDMQTAHELKLYIDNDGPLYRGMTTSILKNLVAKKARGQYKHDLAVKGFGYLTEAGAKKYAQEFGTGPWHKMFDVATRKRVAEELTRDFEEVFAEGNYDRLLPKKYQKAGSSGHSRKKSGLGAKKSSSRRTRTCSCGARVAGVPEWMVHSNEHARNHDGHRWLTDEQGYILEGPSPSSGHARKKSGLGTWPMKYDPPRGIEKAVRKAAPVSQSTSPTARDIWEFAGFLRNVTDRQLQGVYTKEKNAGRDEYTELAIDEAKRRGIDLEEDNGGGRPDHARRKQIEREILQVVPSYRGR